MMPPMGEASLAVLDRLDGLLLPGSPSNVHPSHYDGGDSLTPDHHDLERDATTLRLIPEALARGMPLLAICRGIQELNVALGGTLHQKVHEVPDRMDHRPGPARSRQVCPAPSGVPVGPARAHRGQHEDPGELAARPGDRHAWRRVLWWRRWRRTTRSRRCGSNAPAGSRWVCSGIRNGATPTTAPASRCSARSARRASRIAATAIMRKAA